MDVLVLGTGEGGTTAAQKCAKAVRHVAIVDFRPYGGTCALRGPHAEEVINPFAVAMHTHLPARQFQKPLFAYSSSASDIVYML